MPIDLTDLNFEKEIASGVTLVDFGPLGADHAA